MSVSSLLNSLPVINDSVLKTMLEDIADAPAIYQPSKFWVHYLTKNINEIQNDGIENFKQTVNRNYFNWTGWEVEQQREPVIHNLDAITRTLAPWRARLAKDIGARPSDLNQYYWRRYREHLALLWEFTVKQDKLKILRGLSEPLLGNALAIKYKGRIISQDVCNSVLELNALAEGLDNELLTSNILELGGGYGRTAHVLLHSYPKAKITMVDIPPALYICQWYLSQLHQDRKVFKYRPFTSYEQIKNEFEQALIRFLLPHQLELLPAKSFNACINISSLHEMTLSQIRHWFSMIDRLVEGYFYTKQWINSVNDHDNIVVERNHYPVKNNWQELYNRVCKVQQLFFEALYLVR